MSKNNFKKSKFFIGASVAAVIAGGIVAFLTQTKKGQQLAKKGQQQLLELSKVVARKIEGLKELSKERYEGVVDEVIAEYSRGKQITTAAAKELGQELKKEWSRVKSELKKK